MYIEQLYTGCISEAAYYIESEGEAAIIDPLRDVQPYIELAEKRKAKIVYVFETHFHADFVSGHIDLAKKTGAAIVFGPDANTSYKVYNAKDKESFKLGKVEMEVIHTPGHTLESSCFLLKDEKGKPNAVFTGDTLFVGDVGRPDLLDGIATKEQLAGLMYDSLQKIKTLPDEVLVYPAHGPGSSCGKNLGPETFSTIGNQKKTNYALQQSSKEDFIKILTTGLLPAPKYFAMDASINKKGYSSLDEVVERCNKPLSIAAFENEMKNGALVLDTRHPDDFEKGFVPKALSIGLNGRFAEWVGILLDVNQPIILVANEGKELETIIRMARVGFENVKGYLQDGFKTWANEKRPVDLVISIDADELALDIKFDEEIKVVDVRRPTEFDTAHIKNAASMPLQELSKHFSKIGKEDKLYVHCAAGYRSMIAASILKQNGFHNLRNILGGFGSISKQVEIPILKSTTVHS